MPTYDYVCKKCGHTFEEFQSMLDEPLKTCPECGGNVERLIGTGAGFIFKGSGFYITDNRSDSYKTAASKDSAASSSSTSSKTAEKPAEKKTAATADK